MLSLDYRPKTFADMAGQNLVKKSLMHIVQDPENAPKSLLLCGSFGSGKTTAARIFARALNCPHKLPNGDACGVCEFCKSEIQDSMFYSEYDSAVVGNVNAIKELRDSFYFGYSNGYKVIVFDEVHLVSRAAQGALLKILEEPNPHVFYVLCTTDPEKLLPTIVSRSYELRYSTLEESEMRPFLHKVLTDRGVEITPQIESNLSLLIDRSGGHMRNAMMLLDSMFLLKEDFAETVSSSKEYFIKLILLSLQCKQMISLNKATEEQVRDAVVKVIDNLNTFDMKTLKKDYEKVILMVANILILNDQQYNPQFTQTLNQFKMEPYKILMILNDQFIHRSFTSSTSFQIAMLTLFSRLKELRR